MAPACTYRLFPDENHHETTFPTPPQSRIDAENGPFSPDEFRIHEIKAKRRAVPRKHDWTKAYQGQKARCGRRLLFHDENHHKTPIVPPSETLDAEEDTFSSDEFRMYEFKVLPCALQRSHDWTECPFAHPGEKARRRDPRHHHYSGAACPDFRRAGYCPRGDACEHSHGIFECWLHPSRYRTMPCKDSTLCRRKVCFFAHSPKQLRRVTPHCCRRPLSAVAPSPRTMSLTNLVSSNNLMSAIEWMKVSPTTGLLCDPWNSEQRR